MGSLEDAGAELFSGCTSSTVGAASPELALSPDPP